jgi:hypothetical protein
LHGLNSNLFHKKTKMKHNFIFKTVNLAKINDRSVKDFYIGVRTSAERPPKLKKRERMTHLHTKEEESFHLLPC